MWERQVIKEVWEYAGLVRGDVGQVSEAPCWAGGTPGHTHTDVFTLVSPHCPNFVH